MPRGLKAEKRPADAIGNAVMIVKIATGEIGDITTEDGQNAAAVALGRMAGRRAQLACRPRNGRRSPRRPPQKGGKSSRLACNVDFFSLQVGRENRHWVIHGFHSDCLIEGALGC